MCPQCRKTYLPEVQEVKRDVDFYVPTDNEHNIEPAITSIGHDEDVQIRHEPNYRGSFKQLAAKGIKITDYKVTDGAGRIITEKKEDE
jgi:hypothetical protein